MKLPIIGTFDTTSSINVDSQRSVNWYLEKSPNGRNQAALYPTPGSSVRATAGTGPIRASIEFQGKLFVVSGQDLYTIDSTDNAVDIGTLSTSGTTVSIAASATQLMIVDGVKGYIWDGTTLVSITDVDFPNGATQVIFMEGYFVVNDPDNTQGLQIDGSFFWSDLRDGTSWLGTNFATAERDSDKLIAIEKSHREVWLFGETSTEIWYNSGGDPVFTPLTSGYIEWGIAAKASATRIDQTMVWLSKNSYGRGQIVQATGFKPKVISTRAVDSAISGYTTVEDASAFAMQWKGHTWYVLTFPTENVTWVYDDTEKVWFEWSSWGVGRSIYTTHTTFNGIHYTGDYLTGRVYGLEDTTYTENGEIIERLRRTSHFFDDDNILFYNSVDIEFEYGTGGSTDGQVMLRWSDDFGNTWSKEYWKPIGKLGDYDTHLKWNRLGSSRDRVFEIRITDPIKPIMIAGYAKIKSSSRSD